MVLATKDVEVFGNQIEENRTAGVSVISYDFVMAAAATDASGEGSAQMALNEAAYKADENYSPVPASIYIHDNSISDSFTLPSFKSDIGYLLVWQFGLSIPDILWDGITADEATDNVICLQNNGEATFANMDAGNDFENSSRDSGPFTCKGKVLPEVRLDNMGEMAWAEQ